LEVEEPPNVFKKGDLIAKAFLNTLGGWDFFVGKITCLTKAGPWVRYCDQECKETMISRKNYNKLWLFVRDRDADAQAQDNERKQQARKLRAASKEAKPVRSFSKGTRQSARHKAEADAPLEADVQSVAPDKQMEAGDAHSGAEDDQLEAIQAL
jgi:hypothetical protein